MEATEAAQMLHWLDEEHRKDRAQLTSLQELVEEQSRTLVDLTRRQETLIAELARVRAQIAELAEFQPRLDRVREDLLTRLADEAEERERVDETWRTRAREQSEATTGLARELKSIQEAVHGLRGRLDQLPLRLDDQATQVTGLTRSLEELQGRLTRAQADAATLEHRLADQRDATAGLAHQLQSLQTELASTRADLARYLKLEDAFQQTKNEITLMLRESDKRHQEAAAEAARARQLERESDAKAVAEIRKQLEELPRLRERTQALAAQDTRLDQVMQGLQVQGMKLAEQLKEYASRLPFVDQHLVRLAERLDKTEPMLTQMASREDELGSRIRYLEEWGQRSAEKFGEVERFQEEMRRQQADLAETMRFSDEARRRKLDAWAEELAAHKKQMEDWAKNLRTFAEAHQRARATLAAIEELGKQLARDQNQVMELQRLGMERQQRQLEEWQAENEKRWGLFLKQRGWQWKEQEKADRERNDRLGQLEAWRKEDSARDEALERRLATQGEAHKGYLNALIDFQVEQLRQRMSRLKKDLEELERSRPESPKPLKK